MESDLSKLACISNLLSDLQPTATGSIFLSFFSLIYILCQEPNRRLALESFIAHIMPAKYHLRQENKT